MSKTNRQNLVKEYYQGIKTSSNEQVKKERFITLLTQLFGSHDEFSIINQFTGGAEKSIAEIRREGKKSSRGRADTQYGSVIIEFEHDLKKTGNHAEDQLKDYLNGNWNSGLHVNFTLIATDCFTWKIYTPDYESLIGLGNLKADEIKLECIENFNVNPIKSDEFYYFLDRFIFHSEPLPATLNEIRNVFGYGSDIFQAAMQKMHEHYVSIRCNPDMETAYSQWHKFLSIAYGRFEASERVFLTQSYLSILAKMLAYEVITGDDFIDDDEIKDILNGEAFKKKGISNFTDEDFFRWTAQESNYIALKSVFRAIAQGFSRFDFTNITEDILKGVYQELVDEDTRHALGEHYTPDWLCSYVVDELGPKPGQKILDPSCGSGSFLKATANYFINLKPEITASQLNDCLYGIDVHPLSVQITKATLLIAFGKRIQSEPQPIALNVFLANTLLLPRKEVSLLGNRYQMTVNSNIIDVDESVFSDRNIFYDIIFICDKIANEDIKTKKTQRQVDLNKIFMNRFNTKNKIFIDDVYALYKAFSQAKIEGRDSIWAYIINNSYSPFFLRGNFDFIVGNPPWLTFKDIENNNYQKEIERLAQQYSIYPEKQNLRTQLELAALFLGHCINYFMKSAGELAFVMPRSFFSAGQHSNTREGKAKRVKITKAWDLREVTPLFNVPACVVFAERGYDGAVSVKEFLGKEFKGKLSNHNAHELEARKNLTVEQDAIYLSRLGDITAWSFGQKINLGGVNPYRGLFQQGATIVPRRLFFVDIAQEHTGDLINRRLRIHSSNSVLREAKKPWKDIFLTGTIHSRFMFETALANNVVPFSLNGSHIAALPLSFENNKTKLLTPKKIMAEMGDVESGNWFSGVKNAWDKNKTERGEKMTFLNRLDFMKGLSNQQITSNFIVVYTAAGSNTVSAVISREKKSSLPFIVDHVMYMYFTNNKNEAYYLCGFFNAKIPNQLIKPFQSQGLMGARHIHTKILEVPLPLFDETNPDHITLSTISQQASVKSASFVANRRFDPYGNNMTTHELGRFRNEIRDHVANELDSIDATLANIFGM